MYLVHPNNCLTEISSFEAPNLEAHIKELESQILEIDNHEMDEAKLKDQDPGFLDKVKVLKDFKKSEIEYLQSYLKVLKLVNSIEEKCDCSRSGSTNGVDNYDYEKEDEILAKIEIEMTKFHEFENQLSNNKQHWEIINLENSTVEGGLSREKSLLRNHRNNSMTKFEQTLIENIYQPHIT